MRYLILGLIVWFGAFSARAEMTFRTVPLNATTLIYAEGEITPNSPKKLRAHLKTIMEGQPMIAFNSPGGNLLAGIQIGEILRENGYESTVGEWRFTKHRDYIDKQEVGSGHCLSACALAFMGGTKRTIGGINGKPSKLGFHQFYGDMKQSSNTIISTTQLVSAYIAQYLRSMGADPELFESMSRAGPTEMFIPSLRQMSEMNITTPTTFMRFKLEPNLGMVTARAYLPSNAMGRERVALVEAFCLKNTPILRLFSLPGAHLGGEFVRAWSTSVRVEITTGGRTIILEPEKVMLHSDSPLLASIVLDHATASSLSTGASYVSFNFPSASGVLLNAPIGERDSRDLALQALFNDCSRPEPN